VSATTIQIRAGRLDDLDALSKFTRKTFRWGDYIVEAWPHWVESARGELLVAELDGALVGTVHVRYVGAREAWLEGVRVHPAFRHQRIATTLIQDAHRRAKQKRCRVMRLETFSYNRRAQRLFEKLGYRCVVQYARYRARAAQELAPTMRAANRADAARCWEIWTTAPHGQRAQSLTRAPFGWLWWEFSLSRLREAIRAQRVWLSADARAFMVLGREELHALVLAGTPRGMRELLQGAQGLAKRQKLSRAYWFAPYTARTRALAAQTRFTLDEAGMLIYEYVL